MNFFKPLFCVLLLLIVLTGLSSANLRVCGKSLDQFLDVICVNGFNDKNLRAKKFDPSIDSDDNVLGSDLQPSLFSSLFMNNMHDDQNSLMAKTRRRRHDGVADECCRKTCTLPELLSYCR